MINEIYISLNDTHITDANYSVSSMKSFYNNTNAKKIFEDSLSNDWKNIYNTFSEEEQLIIVESYEEINSKMYFDYNPNNWETIDYLIYLNILRENECAIVLSDIYRNSSSNDIFKTVNDYKLETFKKAVILLTLGNFSPSDLSNEDAMLVAKTISNMKYTANQKTTILRFLGYTVNNNGYINW